MYTLVVPTSVPVSSKKKFPLNLNQYRNAHYAVLHKAKLMFHEQVHKAVKQLPRMSQVKLIYTLFTGTKQLVDVSNVCSIVDKFFSDVLVDCERIEDDNYNIVLSADYRYGGYVKGNSHVVVTIEPVGDILPEHPEEEDETMQITIVQTEIEEAIRSHILSQINVNPGMRIEIDLLATRGATGFQAVIDILPDVESSGAASAKEVDEPTPAKSLSIKDTVTEVKVKTSKPRKAVEAEPEDDGEDDVAVEDEPVKAKTKSVFEEIEEESAPIEGEEEEVAPTRSLFGSLKNSE